MLQNVEHIPQRGLPRVETHNASTLLDIVLIGDKRRWTRLPIVIFASGHLQIQVKGPLPDPDRGGNHPMVNLMSIWTIGLGGHKYHICC